MIPPKEFNTPRTTLTIPRIEDADGIFEEYAQNPNVTKYLNWRPHSNPEITKLFIESVQKAWEEETSFAWVIKLKESDRAIGMFATRINEPKADIGYVLSENFWGKGFMTEIASEVVNWAINRPTIYRVWGYHDVENPVSGRVLQKLNMKKEGILKKWCVHPNMGDIPRDCVSYALTKGDDKDDC